MSFPHFINIQLFCHSKQTCYVFIVESNDLKTNKDLDTPVIRPDYGFMPCGARKRLINSHRFNKHVNVNKDVNSVMLMIPKSNEKHFV